MPQCELLALLLYMVRLVYRGRNVGNWTNHIMSRPPCGVDKQSAVGLLPHPYEPGWLLPVSLSFGYIVIIPG